MTTGPLTGIRVAEFGDLGEVTGKLLADAGAYVAKVEPPNGAHSRHDGPFWGSSPHPERSLKYAFLNTNKLSITLDLQRRQGADAARRLIETVDVVIDTAGPGVLNSQSLGATRFSRKPGLIWCSITPYGLTGPNRNWRANDLTSMAQGGIVMMCGYDDHSLPPIRPEGDHSLWIAGEYAVIGILAMLLGRGESDRCEFIDVSVHEAVAGTTEGAFMNWEYFQRNPNRSTGRHAGTPEQWQLLSADGDYLVLFGGGVPRESSAFSGLLSWMDEFGMGDELHDPKYRVLLHAPPAQEAELRAAFATCVARFVASRPTEEVYRRGQAIGMPWAPVRRPEENLGDPHWEDRGFWVTATVGDSDTLVRYPLAGYRFTESPIVFRQPAPRLGEHTEAVLRDAGLRPAEIEKALIGHRSIS